MILVEKTYNTDNVRIHYVEVENTHDPLVLIHGLMNRWQGFMPVISAFSPYWNIFAPDLRGHGHSEHTPGEYTIDNYTNDIIHFLKHCIGRPAVLCGHSLGGIIASKIASRDDSDVKGIIICDSTLSIQCINEQTSLNSFFSYIYRLCTASLSFKEMISSLEDLYLPVPGYDMKIRWGDIADSKRIRFSAESYFIMDPDILTDLMRFNKGELSGEQKSSFIIQDLDKIAPFISCPVLLIQADPSIQAAMTTRDIETILPLLKNGKSVRLTGVGHGLGLESNNAKQLIAAISQFLDYIRK